MLRNENSVTFATQGTLNLKPSLLTSFKIRDLGAVNKCMGMRVTRDRTIRLDKKAYIRDVIYQFVMAPIQLLPFKCFSEIDNIKNSSKQQYLSKYNRGFDVYICAQDLISVIL